MEITNKVPKQKYLITANPKELQIEQNNYIEDRERKFKKYCESY